MEKTRCHEYTLTRRPGVACSFLAPMASCRGSCRCKSLNGWSWLSFDGLFFNFFPGVSSSLLLLIFQLKFVAAYVMICSWLGVVRAMMFNRSILFYSKWFFCQSKHIKKENNLSHWWTVHLWIEWTCSEKARAKFRVSAERECPGNAGLASL